MLGGRPGPRWGAWTRSLAFQAKKQAKKDKGGGPRDPYAIVKQALGAQPNPEKIKALEEKFETYQQKRQRQADTSRLAQREHDIIMGHLTRLSRMRLDAIEELPPELQRQAREPLLTPIPIDRRVFTETAPIPDFQKKIFARESK